MCHEVSRSGSLEGLCVGAMLWCWLTALGHYIIVVILTEVVVRVPHGNISLFVCGDVLCHICPWYTRQHLSVCLQWRSVSHLPVIRTAAAQRRCSLSPSFDDLSENWLALPWSSSERFQIPRRRVPPRPLTVAVALRQSGTRPDTRRTCRSRRHDWMRTSPAPSPPSCLRHVARGWYSTTKIIWNDESSR